MKGKIIILKGQQEREREEMSENMLTISLGVTISATWRRKHQQPTLLFYGQPWQKGKRTTE